MHGFLKCFKYAWLHNYPCIVNLTSPDGIDCNLCVLFTTDHNLGKFVKNHVENVNGEYKFHENTEYHQTALSREQDFHPCKTHISVDNLDIEDCGDTKSAIIYLQSFNEVQEISNSINNSGFKFTQIAASYKKILTKRIQSKRPETIYLYEEYLGDETRQKEFKEGGGNIEENFLRTGQKRCLANYACGIVNNREKGTVYVGVNDKGRVVGLRCNHEKRDRLRRRIAQIMKCDLNPPLSTIHYSVTFVPVRRADGYDLDDIFVLEITFYTVDKFDRLYTVNGDVYQKSDACLFGPLRPAEIREWETQK
ncbi:unnamed protein product [Mytilus edulis]|uniref:Schlafen AlbA-2 domain-containing protein n=1 Tax=Mytilus edulis TaxID=6550 RepID=A0A8S3V670_MYTED|nr:unnamed protein product [Mytilus edulis]